MRDVERIDKFCDELKIYWKNCPDLRFGQLMTCVFTEMNKEGRDPFFPEEAEMMSYIKKFCKVETNEKL